MKTTVPIKNVLLSVSDKTGIVDFARNLQTLNIHILSTGGTSELLHQNNIPHQRVDEITDFPAIFDGRVKTLHPKIHGGILGKRDIHAEEAKRHAIQWIDLVVVNFYPFEDILKENQDWDKIVEYIDIGGPTMVRAAAKNFAWVGVVVNPNDYAAIFSELSDKNGLTLDTRKKLAEKAFALTSRYDAMIHDYFLQKESSASLHLTLEKHAELRYGENPHQRALAYRLKGNIGGLLSATLHQGKPLSYNNLLDTEAAWHCVNEFEHPTCVIVKHGNPCGVGAAKTIEEAFHHAHQADPNAAFGGIVALNAVCSPELAKQLTQSFFEVIIAPGYHSDALAVFNHKPNLRVLEIPKNQDSDWEMKFIEGGVLMQEKDRQFIRAQDLKVVTHQAPSDEDRNAMGFAWRVLKHIKSNAILVARENKTIAVGAGQVSRVDAVKIALQKAKDLTQNSILASDAFFPFRDNIDLIAKSGIRAIIQPGGSVRDQEVIDACNEHHIAMVFTGMRCFKH